MYVEGVKEFMTESNKIEREEGLNPNDVKVALQALDGIETLDRILCFHGQLTEHLNVEWSGVLRKWDVQVGTYIAPKHNDVPARMDRFIELLPLMDSWTAHNSFEIIHPFADFNGRMGRLIWLSKAINEGYRFGIPFLQMYYYQTLMKEQDK